MMRAAAAFAALALLAAPQLRAGEGDAGTAETVIDWDAARRDATNGSGAKMLAQLKDADAALAQARLPVLVPAMIPADAAFSVLGDTYTLRFKKDGASLVLTGARLMRVPPPGAPKPPGSPDAIRVERTDEGLDLAFARYGAAYQLAVACPHPQSDPLCADEKGARDIVNSLAVAVPETTP